MTQWCTPLSAASTQHYRPVLSRSDSTVTWTHPEIGKKKVQREAGALTQNMKHCEVNQQSHNFLRTFHVIYIDCVAVSTSTSCCKQLSPPCLHPSAYSYKECLLFTKRLTALTFSPRPPLTHVEFLCGLLYCISFRSDMYLQRRSTKLEWIRLSVQ